MNEKNFLICPNRPKEKKNKWWVFCAGPIQGAPDWQFDMPEIKDVTWLSPRRKSYNKFDYDEQILWEHDMLAACDVVLFWVPKAKETVEGRQYAQTTRTEIGEYLALGKKVIIAIDETDFPGKRYIESKAAQYGIDKIHSSLDDALSELKEYIKGNIQQTFFTSDTHFSQQRAMIYSRRPFDSIMQMDWTMISRWNKVVHPNDTVYHLGDFGDLWALQYLNGNIHLIPGNYEVDAAEKDKNLYKKLEKAGMIVEDDSSLTMLNCKADKQSQEKDLDILREHVILLLKHKPIDALAAIEVARVLLSDNKDVEGAKYFALFGHIHGRQRVKPFGIDVGVDANNYAPVSQKEVMLYLNAIDKGFYDQDVWVNQDIF